MRGARDRGSPTRPENQADSRSRVARMAVVRSLDFILIAVGTQVTIWSKVVV